MDKKNEQGIEDMPKVIYSGHFVSEECLNNFLGPAVSGNRMQLGIIKAISNKCDLSLISTTPIATYPHEKTIKVHGEWMNLFDNVKYKKIPFINIFIIKHLTQIYSLLREFKLFDKKNDNLVIINYNPYMELAIPTLKYAKKRKIKTICIVADIPVTIPESYGFVKRFLRKLEINNYYRFIGKYDGLIVLNKAVVAEFAESTPFYLMDGGVTEKEIENMVVLSSEKHDNNQILYAGALEPYNGIKEMIDGFLLARQSNDKIKLVICGGGTLSAYVQDIANNYENIIFKGRVTHEEATRLQRISGLLISTRPIDGFALKLTFPSKIIEYMLSGTPVLTTRLNGLNESYEDKLFFCGQSPEEIGMSILEFFNLPFSERYERANRARKFVELEKTYTYHSEGIIRLIKEVLAK